MHELADRAGLTRACVAATAEDAANLRCTLLDDAGAMEPDFRS
jgi:hypothetical protein